MKACSKCGEEKALDEFYKNHRAPDGRRGDCKTCVLAARRARYESDAETLKARVADYRARHPERVRESQRKSRSKWTPEQCRDRNTLRKYGLSSESFDQMLADQGAACAVCRTDDPGAYWCVDHDHLTGDVRGILCINCNMGLGQFRDDIATLIAAADYLMRTTPSVVADA